MAWKAYEIPRVLQLDNQRTIFRSDRPKRLSARERRENNSERHLARIRQLPCLVVGCTVHQYMGVDPHHLKSGPAHEERRRAGGRASDQWGVPLCRRHHDEVERAGSRGERACFDAWGHNPYFIALALWNKSRLQKDDERATDDMIAVVHQFKMEAARILWLREQTARDRARRRFV
jgi:hypothetical protein